MFISDTDKKCYIIKNHIPYLLVFGSLVVAGFFEFVISPQVIPRYLDIQIYRIILFVLGLIPVILFFVWMDKIYFFELLFIASFLVFHLYEVVHFIPRIHEPGFVLSLFVFSNFLSLFALVFYTNYAHKPLIAVIFFLFSIIYELLYFQKLTDLSPLFLMVVLTSTGAFAVISRLLKLEKKKKEIIERMYKDEVILKTEIAMMKMKMLEQEKTFSLSMLTAGIAHELGNPINYLKGNMAFVKDYVNILGRLLQKKELTDKEAATLSGIITDSKVIFDYAQTGFERMTGIINNLKSIYRGKNRTRERISIKEIIVRTVDFFKVSHGQGSYDIGIDIPSDLFVCVLPGEYYIVFSNIISNAVEAINASGRAGSITVSSHVENGWIVLTVADNGCGFPEDSAGKVFDPFFSTGNRKNNLGLGLALCKDIIEGDGGTIKIEGKKESGAKVTFTIKECLDED